MGLIVCDQWTTKLLFDNWIEVASGVANTIGLMLLTGGLTALVVSTFVNLIPDDFIDNRHKFKIALFWILCT